MDENIALEYNFNENVQKLKHLAQNESVIWDFIDCLMKELEISKKHNKYLEKKLENTAISSEESISVAYVKIKEHNRSLSERNNKLLVHLNETEKKLKDIKKQYDQREREFFEELQMVQVKSAMDFEQMEQKLRWQISETNKDIQKKQIIISKLETQLHNMEEKQNYSSNTLFFPPENEALFKENKDEEFNSEEYLANDIEPSQTQENCPRKSELTSVSFLRTYQPLQVKCSVPSEDKIGRIGNTSKHHVTPLFKGKNYLPKRCKDNKSINSSMIPPLMPCSNSKNRENKKRRLHDPDDLTYLVQLMSDETNN